MPTKNPSIRKAISFKHMPKGLKICGIILFTGWLCLSADCAYPKEQALSAQKQFRIAIFQEKDFPAVGTPELLTPEWLHHQLEKDFSVNYLNSSQLSSRGYLNSGNFDLLILPYGEAFPFAAYPVIRDYLFQGGGLFNVAGRPLWAAFARLDGKWKRIDTKDPYREFLAPLGVKYYEFNDSANIGLTVTTSLGFGNLQPTRGNIFPYRVPARDFYSFKTAGTRTGEQPVLFVKSWRNPYLKSPKGIPQKWCLIGAKADRHPLDPSGQNAEGTLRQIMEYLSFPVIMHGLDTDLAAYYQKEKVNAALKVINNGNSKEQCVIDFELLDKQGNPVYKKQRYLKLNPRQETVVRESWRPQAFKSNFYKIAATLRKGELILDREENGFVIIDEGEMKKGPSLKIEGDTFLINGQRSLLLGVNYYDSKLGELMWLRPNLLRIREDFQAMRGMGINFIRIHYHHSKWFRDYFSCVSKEELDPYFSVADKTIFPSERSWRILDAIIQLAQEQGLIFCADIFSLVPAEMGNPAGWLGFRERIAEKDRVSLQKGFIKLLADRYKNIPGITWDLWNEPRLKDSDLGLLRIWARGHREAFRENGDNHLITIGDNASLDLLDVLDYASVHTYRPQEFSSYRHLNQPVIFQEVWNEAGCDLGAEKKQAEKLTRDFKAFLKTKAAGFCPWQWTRQSRLWDNASDAEKWDNDLGLCVREDGTIKPAGITYAALIRSTATNKSRGKTYLDMAHDYYEKRRYLEAIRWYKEAIKTEPQNSAGYASLGRIYSEQKNYPQAIKWFQEAIRVGPGDTRGYEGLGRVYLYMGNYPQAIKWFQEAAKRSSDYNYACPYQGLGQVYQKLGKPLLAEENFMREITKDPHRYKGYYDLAEYYCQTGKLEKAGENIEKAMRLATEDAHKDRVLKLKGLILIMQQDYAGAEKIFNDLGERHDLNAFTQAGLGHLYNARKDYKRARACFEEAIKARGQDGWDIAMLGLGWVNANEGKHREAIKCYEQVLEGSPLNVLSLLGKGNAYNWLREYDNAEKCFRRVLEIDHDNEYALAELATVYLNRGENKKAEEFFAQSLKINNSTYSCPYEGLGLVYLKQNKLKEAEESFKKAISVNPDIEYKKYNGLSRIYIQKGMLKEARELLKKSISNYPYDNEARELLKEMEAKTNDK